MEAGISTNDVAGVFVFVDDVYIPKTGSATGDNLIKDGSCELQTEALCEQCYWMPRVQTVIVGTVVSTSISTSISINDVSRKSGSRALYLKVPYCEDCTTTTYTNSAKVVASIGTNIDFTDLLSCNDYVVDVELDQSDIDNASTILTYSDQVIHINSDLEITGKTLEFIGCLVVVESDASSPVAINIQSTGNLIVKPLGAKPTHFFGCNDMWQGIKNNNGNVTINTAGGATIFEDATKQLKVLPAM
ncbi:MAG: hypothetical protein IPP71_11950 [Bacteroidetes bacterium]|nr:hypothetical protein [Bacteroidota bacterium]